MEFKNLTVYAFWIQVELLRVEIILCKQDFYHPLLVQSWVAVVSQEVPKLVNPWLHYRLPLSSIPLDLDKQVLLYLRLPLQLPELIIKLIKGLVLDPVLKAQFLGKVSRHKIIEYCLWFVYDILVELILLVYIEEIHVGNLLNSIEV